MVGDWTASSSGSYRSCPGSRPNAIKPQHSWPPWWARKVESRVNAGERDQENSRYPREKNQPDSCLLPSYFSLSHLSRNCNASWKWSRDELAASSTSLSRKPPRGKRAPNRRWDETAGVEAIEGSTSDFPQIAVTIKCLWGIPSRIEIRL